MDTAGTIHCPSDAFEIELPHRCRRTNADRPIVYVLGPRGRARLAEGQTVPVTARCADCEGREFVSLVDREARSRAVARRGAEITIRPADDHVARVREFAGRPHLRPLPRPNHPCPACGVVPDRDGHCQCSE
ncbi:MAG: hypothetical protein EPO26_13235 [Chloroflexota bacterium]|nr:MAG: hypothetical protein EPO26_13235 [Chloroflexota bacterium]